MDSIREGPGYGEPWRVHCVGVTSVGDTMAHYLLVRGWDHGVTKYQMHLLFRFVWMLVFCDILIVVSNHCSVLPTS